MLWKHWFPHWFHFRHPAYCVCVCVWVTFYKLSAWSVGSVRAHTNLYYYLYTINVKVTRRLTF